MRNISAFVPWLFVGVFSLRCLVFYFIRRKQACEYTPAVSRKKDLTHRLSYPLDSLEKEGRTFHLGPEAGDRLVRGQEETSAHS